MSQHQTQRFTNFTKSQMDAGLSLHHLPADAPSQLADAFRAGAEWGAQQSQDAKLREAVEALLSNEEHAASGGMRTYQIGSQTWEIWEAVRQAMLAEGNK